MNDAFAADTADTLPFTGLTPYGRPSWSGLLQFSLVGIPLKAYPAVRTRDVPSAHLLHADCGERLRYAKHCPVHGAVDNAAIVRGYEYGPGQHVLVEPDALDELRPAQDKALRLERFLAPAQLVECIGFDEDMPARAIFVATDDGGIVNGSVDRAVLGVAEAFTTVGVQQMGGRYVTGADGGIGLERNANQAELQQSRPTGPAIGR